MTDRVENILFIVIALNALISVIVAILMALY